MSGIQCDREDGEHVVASDGTGAKNPSLNHDEVRYPKVRKGLRFSLRAMLLLTTLFCIWIVHISNQAFRAQRAIEFLEGAQVGGRVKSYRDAWYANLTPEWLQNGIGKEYFRTPTAIDLEIRLNTTDSDDEAAELHGLHNAQQIIESLSHFKRLEFLVLRLTELDSLAEDDDPTGKIDVSSIKDIEVARLDLHGSNRLAADLVGQMQVDCLSICQCEVTEPFLNSIVGNRHIHTVNFQQARILPDKLLGFGAMKNLRSIKFSECRPGETDCGPSALLAACGPRITVQFISLRFPSPSWQTQNLPHSARTRIGP